MLGAARFVGRDEELVRPGDGCCSVPSPCAEAMEYWQSLTGRGAVVEWLGWAGLGWLGLFTVSVAAGAEYFVCARGNRQMTSPSAYVQV